MVCEVLPVFGVEPLIHQPHNERNVKYADGLWHCQVQWTIREEMDISNQTPKEGDEGGRREINKLISIFCICTGMCVFSDVFVSFPPLVSSFCR